VRAEDGSDRWFAASTAAVLLGGGATVGALVGGAPAAAIGAALGLAAAAAYRRTLRRRSARRQALLARAFPTEWRRTLVEGWPHFTRLPAPLQERFERDVNVFLGEKTITGVGIEADDELRLLVAASAVTLSVAWPGHDWDALTEVLLYPDDFDRDYNFGGAERVGEAHTWGTVILSAPALEESFDDPDDGYHVGLHEFAHLLGLQLGEFDGVPVGLSEARSREWVDLVPHEMGRIRSGASVLDEYGAESPVEFFAVSVEAFFELPLDVRADLPAVYDVLAEYFAQDPASWEAARARPRRRRRGRRR
jgi:Mlc titration factor MtfA (ptsG expression regulator)